MSIDRLTTKKMAAIGLCGIGMTYSGMLYAVDANQADQLLNESVAAPAAIDAASFVQAEATSTQQSTVPATPKPDSTKPADPVINAPIPTAEEVKAKVSTALTSAVTPAANTATPSMVPSTAATGKDVAAQALQANESDANSKKNIVEVFTQNKSYSLAKKGTYALNYDLDYSFYRDTQVDIATADGSSTITRLRMQEDAQHTVVNTFDLQYGLKDNITISVTLPLIVKADISQNKHAAGIGDIGFGLRWEPFELERDKLPLTLSGSLSTKTGDSPYEIDSTKGLSTGKGYYSLGGGASTRKYVDPVVLFASGSLGYGLNVSNLDQVRGSRVLTSFQPGFSGGISAGFAYSLNYDVSLTISVSQSFSVNSLFKYKPNSVDTNPWSRAGFQSSASMNFSMGIRVTPKLLVNGSVGFGLTPDAPDLSLGLSFPLDFNGFGHSAK